MKDYLNLALKNLKHRGVRSWLTLLGVFIGIAAVVSLISLGTALRMAVSAQFGISSTEVISVRAGGVSGAGPPGMGVSDPLNKDDVKAIEKISLIDYAFGRLATTQKIKFGKKTHIGLVYSVPDGEKRKFAYSALDFKIEKGRFLKDGDTNKVVVGYNFFSGKDDFERPVNVGEKLIISGEKFEVVGILKKKGSFIWDNAIMMNEEKLREISDYGDKVDIIVAKVKRKEDISRAEEEIEKVMRKRRNVKKGNEDFVVSTPKAALESVKKILNGVSIFVTVIALISVFVGAVGIVNTMTTSVLERRREIGIMKAIGAQNLQIFFQFLIESGLLGFVGGVAGVVFGIFVGFVGTYAINHFIGTSLGPDIDFLLIGMSLLGSFVIGAVAGVVPAMRASKQNPVEALRA
ncbi:ABC transporter permease [Candidatus Pacearchaeota archaeon]|nr:MAG: ABC transporter permease [Candidatus Pacearchaeota archaeon]